MFTLTDRRHDHNCQGYRRREFLRAGALGLAGLTLPNLLAARAAAKQAGLPIVRDKSVVLLFLQGGPPHIEFFDPKMSAPSDVRSITGEIRTRLPGVTFGSTFPQLAAMADRLAVVRSYGSGNADHSYLSVTSAGNDMKASVGAVYTRVAGINNPRNGMPNHTLILPEAVDPDLKLDTNFETQAMHTLTDPGSLGSGYKAFDASGGGQLHSDMTLSIDAQRLTDRRGLLDRLDRIRQRADADASIESANRYQQQAFEVITGGVAEAFDLSKEDARTIERYDTRRLFDAADLQKWFDMRRATNLLGLQMLMARRLCEAGCGFVTVSDCGWDYHANSNSPKNMAGIYPMGGQVDHAVAAFLQDIEARGLSEKILLIVTGEMGRTPRLNNNGGREHYGNLTSLLVAGGGLKMGQVVGESDRLAAEPLTRRYTPRHLLGTILHTLFDIGELRLASNLPRELVSFATEAEPIAELF